MGHFKANFLISAQGGAYTTPPPTTNFLTSSRQQRGLGFGISPYYTQNHQFKEEKSPSPQSQNKVYRFLKSSKHNIIPNK
jgi:hypothetical protein